MAIQFWTPDQVPQLRFAGAQSLAGGISRGAESIRQGLDKLIEEKKRIKQAGKAADAFYKALPDNLRPMPQEFWDVQSSSEKADAMVGLIGAQKYQQGVSDAESQAAQTAFTKQRTSDMQQAIEREAAFNQRAVQLAGPPSVEQMQAFYEGPDTMMPEERFRPTMGPVTPEIISQAAIESGSALNPNVGNLILDAARAREMGAEPAFIEDPSTGARFLRHRGTVLPSVDRTQAELEIITEPSTGLKFRRTKDGFVPLPGQTLTRKASPLEQAQVKAATTQWDNAAELLALEMAKTTPNQKRISEYNKTIENASNVLSRLSAPVPSDTTNGESKKAAPEAPRDPKQREANKVYVTPRGELRWTGTGWVQP